MFPKRAVSGPLDRIRKERQESTVTDTSPLNLLMPEQGLFALLIRSDHKSLHA